ncbi:hypothetical protein [Dyadobacter helix]|nr:hypothetical protein [Dyadobacter sp. CECT 9275]
MEKILLIRVSQIKLKDYWGVEDDADATPRSSDGQLLFTDGNGF